MLRRLGRALTARWLITLIGALVLALLVWFVGPLIAVADVRPLGSELARLIAVVAILVVWGLANLFAVMRVRRSNEAMVAELAKAPAAAPDAADAAASAEEVAALKERLVQALERLKRAKLGGGRGRQYLYQLPWYILIGPPGSGKTTALVNSGLSFPLADQLGKDAVRGVGGTRTLDWWFTNEAVLIDTAGRYTTQDSHQAVDAAAWTGFLNLLKKYRPRQPINGALVAISLPELVAAGEAERQAHARTIRQRLRELHDQLGLNFPIYVLFTKTDLIAGFVEFFDDLDREGREQVWGMTFAPDDGKSEQGVVAAFGPEFDALIRRLDERLLERVHQEPDAARRGLIYAFPLQMASVKQVAQDFLDEIFRPSRFEARPMLRGVYFTSGTQEGTPIDRIMGALAATFGIGRERLSAFSGAGRSYFLTRPLRDVVFREAGVVGANQRYERRRVWIQRAAFALAALVTVGMAGAWLYSYAGNRHLIGEAEASVDRYAEQIAALDPATVSDADFGRVLPVLDTLRTMPAGYETREAPVPVGLTLGLYQGGKLTAQSEAAYHRALNALLLPRLVLRLEDQIRANMGTPDYLYQALKVYLMLGGQGPLNADLVRQWATLTWAADFPGPDNQDTVRRLAGHLDALLDLGLGPVALDGGLVDEARRQLTRSPPAERAYAMITQDPEVRALPEWRVVDHAGPGAARVFARVSGRPLTEGIPGLYTYDGFHQVFLPRADAIAREVAEDSWVLGPEAQAGLDGAGVDRLERDVMALYYNDYATQWDGLLGDLTVVPFQSLDHAVEVLNLLSGPSSPLRTLLEAIARETTLTAPPEGAGVAAAAEGVVDVAKEEAMSQLAGRTEEIVKAIGRGTQAEAPPPPPGQFIDDRFAQLHDLVRRTNNAAPIDDVIATLDALYREMNRLAGSGNRNTLLTALESGEGGAAQQLMTQASRLPPPVGQWLAGMVQDSSSLTVGGARSQLSGEYTANLLPVCRQALQNRYPFARNSSADVTLDDFTRLFAPGGLFDSFFNAHLKSFVDTSTRPWKWQRVENVDFGLSDDALVQFQRAAAIRDAFFPAGTSPQIRFDLMPVSLDASATQVLLEVGDQIVTYNHGPPRPAQLQWPTQTSQARVSFSPPSPGGRSSLTADGPWAWFRLLDQGKIAGGAASDRFDVTFDVGGRTATFELRASSVNNPFTMRELEQFRCPASL